MVTKKQITLIESKRGADGLFSKTDLVDLKKSEQVYILREQLGLNDQQIKLLSTEKKRIDKILSLQKPIEDNSKEEVEVKDIVNDSPDIIETVTDIEPEQESTTEVYSEESNDTNEVSCIKCGNVMENTGAGPSGQDYKCKTCGFGMTVNIN